MCLGTRINVVLCAGKRKRVDTYQIIDIYRKSPYISRAIRLEFKERCDRKTKGFTLVIFGMYRTHTHIGPKLPQSMYRAVSDVATR